MNPYNRVDPNARMPNQIMVSRPRAPVPNNNPRFVYIASPSNFAPVQNTTTNVPAVATQQLSNQNSITNKLCKFFMNLLELERDQGRYDESVTIIQRYINKEINVDELGNQLKRNASRAPLPESLITSLKSNIDDLRREMFFGRVKIDRINPPPESVIEMNVSSVTTPVMSSVMSSPVNTPRIATPTQNITRPTTTFSPQTGISTRPAQPSPMAAPQLIRQPTLPIPQPRQTRPIGNSVAAFTPQTTLSISNASLRSIAPSSPARPALPMVTQPVPRPVSVPTASLASVRPTSVVKTEDYKTEVAPAEPVRPIEAHQNHVTLPTNIVNHANYRHKISEVCKGDHGTVGISEEALHYVSEAIENFSVSLLEQAAAFACHRQELFSQDPMYKKIDDVRSQMRYLQDYEDYQRASEEERHKAELFKAAKSRSKADNQEQQMIKETVRKIQEYDKNCDEYTRANKTALNAIGTKRKMLDVDERAGGWPGMSVRAGGDYGSIGPPPSRACLSAKYISTGGGGIRAQTRQGLSAATTTSAARQRTKRIILKDFQLVLDQDVKLKRFKTFKKIFMFGRY